MKDKNHLPFTWDTASNSLYQTEEGVSFKQQAALDIFCAMVSCDVWVQNYKFEELREQAIKQAELLVNEIPE